eukprot:s1700_g11.t1
MLAVQNMSCCSGPGASSPTESSRFRQQKPSIETGHWAVIREAPGREPSGRCATVSVVESGTVADLKIATQQSFGQGFLRLAAPDGRLVDLTAGLQDGDSLTAVAQQPKITATRSAFAISRVQDQLRNVQQICSTDSAFAAILADESVVTWGNGYRGGNSSRVRDQLKNVQKISGIYEAFATILADGSVVTWGEQNTGGDSSRVQGQLRNVKKICSTYGGAFGSILADGSVVTWGDHRSGGNSSRL